MAYIRDSKYAVNIDGAATTIAVDSMPEHQSGDLILVFLGKDSTLGGAWTITGATGYTQITNQQFQDLSSATFYKVASSSSETIPVGSQTDPNEVFMYVVVVADVDTTTPIDTTASQSEAFGLSGSHSLTSPNITSANNTMNFYWHLVDNSNGKDPTQPAGLMTLTHPQPVSTWASASLSWTYQLTAGTVPNPTFKLSATEQGHIVNVVVNSKVVSPTIAPHVDYNSPPTSIVHPLRSLSTNGAYGGGNVDPTTDLSGGIGPNSETFNYRVLSADTGEGVWAVSQALEARAPASSSANEIWGSVWDLTAGSVDMTGKNACVHVSALNGLVLGSLDKVSNGGLIFGLRTNDLNNPAANAYRFWNVGAVDSLPSLYYKYGAVMDVNDSTYQWGPDAGSEVTPVADLSAVTGVFLAINKGANVQPPRMNFTELHSLNDIVVVGGGEVAPCDLSTVVDSIYAPRILTVINQGGSSTSQLFAMHPISIGNGSTPTFFKQNAANLEFATTTARKNLQYSVGDNGAGITFYGVSGDTIRFTNSTISGGSVWDFVIHASSTSAATWDFNGLNVINADVVLRDVFTAASGITFIDCPSFAGNNADLSGGCTFNNTPVSISSETGLLDFYNCTFRNNAAAITITGDQTGSWSDPSLTVSGNTVDIEYTGATDFSIQSAATLTVSNTGAGTLTIVTPTFDLTVNSSETASQINVFATGTQTLIDTEASASQLTYTHSSETVDITVLKDGYIPFRQTGVALSGNVTIDVQLVKSREYLSSHGLTYTTDASWATNQLTVPTWGVTGQQVFSLIMEAFKSQTALRNTAFNLQMDGANSLYLVNDAEGASDASIENLIDCGVAYLDPDGIITASWCGVKSVGTATGFTGEYQQVDGSGTTDARATGAFNEVVKMYGDITHGNFDYTGHLVLKYQPNGYREERADVLDAYGISALSPTLYIVAMQPVAISAAVGDPAITLTVTDHGATPVTWNSKNFSITITADAANSGEDILRELNYNLSLDATYNGKDPFNWPEMVLEAGSAYETARGITEGGVGAALKGVRVIDGGGNPHPAFTRMQADDGTYYVVPVTANVAITGIEAGSRLRIYNETTLTETYNDVVAGTSYSDSYTDGTTYSDGDVITIYLTYQSGVTAKLGYTASAVASTSGWSVIANQLDDTVYNTNGIDGSLITKFTADYANDEIDVTTASNFTGPEVYAFFVAALMTADGIRNSFGGFTALDEGNYRNNSSVVSMNLDNTTVTEVWQTDTSRLFRSDGARPIRNPTSGGGGIDINWQNVVYVVTAGSGLTAGQAAELTAAASASTFDPTTDTVEGSETWQETMRLVRANAAGKLAQTGNTVTIRDAADTKDRITATVDDDGQRTAVTTDVS